MNYLIQISVATLAAVYFITTQGGAILADDQPTSLPDNWQSLSIAEFVPLVQSFESQGLLSAEQRDQVHQHAAELLQGVDYAMAEIEGLPILEGLQQLGWKRLGADGRLRIINQVLARQDDWTDRPYEEVRAKVMLLNRGKQNMAAFVEGRRWVQAGGSVEKARQSLLGVADLKQPLAALAVEALLQGGEPIYREVDLKWEGSIMVPATGDCTFRSVQ